MSSLAFTQNLNKALLVFFSPSLSFIQPEIRPTDKLKLERSRGGWPGRWANTSTAQIQVPTHWLDIKVTSLYCSWVKDPRLLNYRQGRSCGSTSTWKSRTPKTTTGGQTSRGRSSLLLTRCSFRLPSRASAWQPRWLLQQWIVVSRNNNIMGDV